MPEGKFYNLGKKPTKMNDMGREDKIRYPNVYDVSVDKFPPLKDMKLGDMGEAVIHFKINGGGLDIHEMKFLGSVADTSKEKTAEKPELAPASKSGSH